MEIGEIHLEFLGHSGFLIKHRKKIIIIDPYHVTDSVPHADFIFISHGHYDHCSIKDIVKVSRKGTSIFCPVDCQSSVMKVKDIQVQPVEIHDIIRFPTFSIECVPAYNLSGKPHSKQEGWLGYVLKFGKTIIYFAGDTDLLPEHNRLSGYGKKGNTFVTLLPVAGGVVMNAVNAAKLASILKPAIAIPMSYGSGVYGSEKDAQLFVDLCKQKGIDARMMAKL